MHASDDANLWYNYSCGVYWIFGEQQGMVWFNFEGRYVWVKWQWGTRVRDNLMKIL